MVKKEGCKADGKPAAMWWLEEFSKMFASELAQCGSRWSRILGLFTSRNHGFKGEFNDITHSHVGHSVTEMTITCLCRYRPVLLWSVSLRIGLTAGVNRINRWHSEWTNLLCRNRTLSKYLLFGTSRAVHGQCLVYV